MLLFQDVKIRIDIKYVNSTADDYECCKENGLHTFYFSGTTNNKVPFFPFILVKDFLGKNGTLLFVFVLHSNCIHMMYNVKLIKYQ